MPEHLKGEYTEEISDVTPAVLKHLDFLGVDYLIPIGGDDTLSYAYRLAQEGVKVIAVPKTMDNDVPGTDYCIGFSTCVTRTIELTHRLRTSAGSHERFLVIEVFGRYASIGEGENDISGGEAGKTWPGDLWKTGGAATWRVGAPVVPSSPSPHLPIMPLL